MQAQTAMDARTGRRMRMAEPERRPLWARRATFRRRRPGPAVAPEFGAGHEKAAMAAGGRDNGKPGERHYHPGYYAAFVLDPDGNNVEAVHHGEAVRSAESVVITPKVPGGEAGRAAFLLDSRIASVGPALGQSLAQRGAAPLRSPAAGALPRQSWHAKPRCSAERARFWGAHFIVHRPMRPGACSWVLSRDRTHAKRGGTSEGRSAQCVVHLDSPSRPDRLTTLGAEEMSKPGSDAKQTPNRGFRVLDACRNV